MLPWGHIAVGYLTYSLGIRIHYDRAPGGYATIALVVATQLPDLIDKPFTTWLSVLPSGRSLGHSFLLVLAVGIVIWKIADRTDVTGVAGGFIVGLLSHIVADAIDPVVNGRWAELGYLLWPLTSAYEYPTDEDRIFSEYLFIQLVSEPHHELALFGLALVLWFYDGIPGVAEVRSWIYSDRNAGD